MKKPIRLLIIEDSDDDKELLLMEIKRGGYEPDFVCLETADALNTALDGYDWDIILSDFAMPKFNGLAALQIVKERGIDIPFIIVSGTIGEDIAVTAMKAGAQDYIMKGNLKRLIPALERELKEAEIRKQRKLSEKALHESEEKFRKAFFFSPDSIAILRAVDGVFVSVNKGFTQITGLAEADIIGKTSAEINIWADPDDEQKFTKELQTWNEVQNFEAAFLARNGKIDGLISASIIELDGQPHILNIIRDITERKIAAEKISQLSRAVEQSPTSIIITDINGKIEYVNPKAIKTSGYSLDELIGQNLSIFNSGDLRKEAYDVLWNTILSGNEYKGEFRNKKKNGELYWESVVISPIKNDYGKFSHFLAIKEDITDRKKIEQDLIHAKELAEQSNNLKDAFMANISHEIRTPLNGILGMTSIIHEIYSSLISPDEEKYFKAISLSSNRITRTIDTILNYSQLQIGNFPLHPKSLNLSTIIKEQIKRYNVIAASKNVELLFENKTDQLEITGDEYCINNSIASLIDNALKFTEKGFVKLTLFENEIGNICLDVKDTGIGISEEYLANLFNPYSQEDVGYSRSYEGLGLSLSLTKEFLNLNGADISVVSKKDSGSVFTISFNKKRSIANQGKIQYELTKEEGANEKSSPIDEEKKRIFIVEDDAINLLYMKSQLQKFFDVTVASSAVKALEKLKINRVDIILMDISLQGGMNGLELTQMIKSDEKYSGIPVIAVTGHAFKEDRERIIGAGCDDYLAKPFQINELLDKIKSNIK